MSVRVIIVSASDARFMPFLQALIATLPTRLDDHRLSLGCLDLGLTEEDRAWLAARGWECVKPDTHLGVPLAAHSAVDRSYLARPFLPTYFPGHDVYVWIDSDLWLQSPQVLQAYVDGALAEGMAVTHEREASYRLQLWLYGWTAKHFMLGLGASAAAALMLRPHLNAGFFAIHANAPHWRAWASSYADAIRRTGALFPYDQFALNHAIYGSGLGRPRLPTRILPPGNNWICDRGIPMWNDDTGRFCMPRAPYETIGAMHLAGPAKRTRYRVRRTGGGGFDTYLIPGASPTEPSNIDILAESPAQLAGQPT
jgi:hypothetical protein